MKKLTKLQIELLKKFVDTFDVKVAFNGAPLSFENAVAILEDELPNTKTIEERRKDFVDTLAPHLHKYGGPMLNKFYFYWGKNEGTKLKFEHQKTWDLELRLEYWKRNDEEFQRRKYIQQLNDRF